MPAGRPRRVAIAVRSWASEESVFVWTWAQKYFIRTGRDRDWLYIVHVNTIKDKSRDSWKAPGPTIPDLDRALQGYSYDLVELSGETAAHSLVRWVDESSIDVLVISAGRSRRLPNPMQSRTTDYIAANAACATLVIQTKMSLADLTRVRMTSPSTSASGIGAERRVAYAEESQEGLNIMMNWAACNLSRQDDSEFQVMSQTSTNSTAVQINRNSMLARVSKIIAPPRRRPPGYPHGASTSNVSGLQSAFEGPSTPNSDSAPLPGTATDGADDPGVPAVLKGKPSQVIQRFVRENNIDLMVIPVTPQSALRRMDKESKRDLKPSKTFVYHKAECTCLCVPAHLLKLQNGGPTATSSGLLLSEDEFDDEPTITMHTPHAGHSSSPSRRLSVELHMRHMEPIIRQDAHLPGPRTHTLQPGVSEPSGDALIRGRHGSLSPPPSSEGEPRRRRSSAPASRNVPAFAPSATPAATTVGGAAPATITASPAAAAASASASTAAGTGESVLHALPAAASLHLQHTARNMLPGQDEGSPRSTLGSTGGSSSSTLGVTAAQGGTSGGDRGGGDKGSGGLFSSLRSRVGKLNSSLSSSHRERKESKENLSNLQVPPASTTPAPPPQSVTLTTLDAQLSDLQCVLQEGGLSGEVRERGAEAVARARSALCMLAAEAAELRSKLEEKDERRNMAIAMLEGKSHLPAPHTAVGAGNGSLNGTANSLGSVPVMIHASPISHNAYGPRRSHSNVSNASGHAAAAVMATIADTSVADSMHTGSERLGDSQTQLGGVPNMAQRVSTGGVSSAGDMAEREGCSGFGERTSDGGVASRVLSHTQLVPGGVPQRTATPVSSVLTGSGEEEELNGEIVE